MILKQFSSLVVVMLSLALGRYNTANGQDDKNSAKPVTTPTVGAYLGIGVEALHPAFGKHLSNSLIEGQGILVSSVVKDSPAEKAGMKAHDILSAYDDQRLFSADQLVKLVRADKPGRSVTLQLVRDGKIESVQVKLGEQPTHLADHSHRHRDLWERQFPTWQPFSPLRPEWQSPFNRRWKNWQRFESLNLKKLDGDRFRAEIGYVDKDGKKQHRTFEGTREEIHKQIEDQKDLLEDERDDLLQGLDLERSFFAPHLLENPFGPPLQWPDPFRDF